MNNQTPGKKIVNNADFFNQETLQKQTFPRGSRFFMQTDDYVGDFTIIEERNEQGTDFRQITGTAGTVVVPLHYLQREAARGNIRIEGQEKQNEDDNSGKSEDN